MQAERTYHDPAELLADRLARVESLATIILENARHRTGSLSWGDGGSLTHVAARLAELADFLEGSEDGAHGALETIELRALAGVGEFPDELEVDGEEYAPTGKTAKRVEDGRPVAEFRAVMTDLLAPVWVDVAGNVYPD